MKKVLIDTLPVLVGILLAVIVNNWRESLKNKNYLRNSIESIVKQNLDNIKELEFAIGRQDTLRDTLIHYLSREDLNMSDILNKTRGATTPDLKSTTWKFLVENENHTLVSYEFINRLSEIEKYQLLINRYNEKVSDLVFQPAFFTDPKMKQVWYVFFSDMDYVENKLLEEIRAFNKYVGEEYGL